MSKLTHTESPIELPESFVHSTLCELKSNVNSRLEQNSELRLDSSNVDRIDGAAVQFLFHCHAHCTLNNYPFSVENLSDTVRDALVDIGMEDLIPEIQP